MLKIKLEEADVVDLKILYSYLTSDMTKKELNEVVKKGEYPPRLRAIANILNQADKNFLNNFKV